VHPTRSNSEVWAAKLFLGEVKKTYSPSVPEPIRRRTPCLLGTYHVADLGGTKDHSWSSYVVRASISNDFVLLLGGTKRVQ
jgi:hypothetical protein